MLSGEQQCAVRVVGELREAAWAPVVALDQALADDSVVGPRLDHDVTSSGAGGQTWQAASLVVGLVDSVFAADVA